jgi:methylphosphotriester-DNA--protein-cysteine methyltransferase
MRNSCRHSPGSSRGREAAVRMLVPLAVLGNSPLSYFQDLRVERAQSLLHSSGMDIEAIAAEVGYEGGATPADAAARALGTRGA